MADGKPSSGLPAPGGWRGGGSGSSKADSGELEALREETKRLRQLVIQLSRIAIRNAVNMK
jgi:hypothetical protein